jgi:hypothetical protein
MANRDEVSTDMFVRLYTDNKLRLFQAGAAWEQMQMKFYYFADNQVDIATKQVMIANLKRDGKTLQDAKWTELRLRVNLDTPVSDAIDIITEISNFAT